MLDLQHCGGMSIARLPHDQKSMEDFQHELIDRGFILKENTAKRSLKFSEGDWPIVVKMVDKDTEFEIFAYMYIPPSWIILTIAILALIPSIIVGSILGLRIKEIIELGAILDLLLIIQVFAIFKFKSIRPRQKFDLNPNDKWQEVPRGKWGRIFEELINKIFKS